MGYAEKRRDDASIVESAASKFRTKDVPADWFVDPVLPAPAGPGLEDQATAFLAAHEAAEAEALASEPAGTKELIAEDSKAVWIGLLGPVRTEEDGALAWQSDALCAQTDPEAFFPEKGGSTRDAKKVCGSCTVKAQCLQYALENDERFGIWGGMSERERRRLRKRAS